MPYSRHSFLLLHPLRKHNMGVNKADCAEDNRTLQRHPRLSKSEITLYTSPFNGLEYYGLEKLEDFYFQEERGSFPDFYGGYPIPQYGISNDTPSDYESVASESVSPSECGSVCTALTFNSSGSGKVSTSSSETISDIHISGVGENSKLSVFETNSETDVSNGHLLELQRCYRDNFPSSGPLYRLKFHCSDQMEPLWEAEDNVQFQPGKERNWHDRKIRHKSCPMYQAHMVAAFEHSLSNMTDRFQHLTASAEQKDSQLGELRNTIEALKKQSTEAGLTKIALQSMQATQRTMKGKMSRQFSTDSVSSVNSQSSTCSNPSVRYDNASCKGKKKRGWLRDSFSKAFSRSKKNKNGSISDVEDLKQFQYDSSTPNSPLLESHPLNKSLVNSFHSASNLCEKDDHMPELVKDLKKQLREKDMALTDIRLEALTSAHQLESLKDTVNKLKAEIMNLKQHNERLQRILSSKSVISSNSSVLARNSMKHLEKNLSSSEHSGPPNIATYLNYAATDENSKRVIISAYLCCHGNYKKVTAQNEPTQEMLIGSVSVNAKTKWDLLDNVVKKAFKEYLFRIDPVTSLGLNAESVLSYHTGNVVRAKEADIPDLLPCGYLIGDNMQIRITLKGTKQNSIDALAFETLIPKSVIQRYVSMLLEHRRIILCGPSGTGKTYLAQKLAEFLVFRNGKDLGPGAVATFSVDPKSAKELQQYLSNLAEQCESSNSLDLPTVIILDNLHHVGSLDEVFNGFLSAKYQNCPYIIGTMNQTTCSTTNLQLHHNFRWILCANHMEPVKRFLGRYLRRKLVEEEVYTGVKNPILNKIIDWVPEVWAYLNKFLETHSSSDVTIGPRLFLSCPVDVSSSQVWFTDLWNYSIIPYLLEAVREGLQLYGRRAHWEDPTEWVQESYPWPSLGDPDWPQLLRLRPEDVGYEGHPSSNLRTKSVQNEVEADPLFNMLMRLQEAARYSSLHNNDNESTSVHSTEDFLNTELESTL